VTALARIAAVALIAVFSSLGMVAAADTGWDIDRFVEDIDIGSDGQLVINEQIDVDFHALARHGIFRDIPVQYEWPADRTVVRVYRVSVTTVRSGAGAPLSYETSTEGAYFRIKIGDADRTVTGKQAYRITYTVRGALNAFSDHDELFWNAYGDPWPVPAAAVSAIVRLPAEGITRIDCFQGPRGSRTPCRSSATARRADFAATAPLQPGQDLTVVVGMRKGLVSEPQPILTRRARGITEWFDTSPAALGTALFVLIASLGAVVWRWWSAGRDDRERQTIVPEFEPPDKLRPAQLGLLVDEYADPKDVTATIVDLAVRGYLTITERPGAGLFATKDWTLARTDKPVGDELQPYELTILDGLFASDQSVDLSALRDKFHATLAKAEDEIYGDSVKRGWFASSPDATRIIYRVLGFAAIAAAAGATWLLGSLFGDGLVGLAAGIGALALLLIAPLMPAKTRAGAEVLRRTLGFRRYMEVAETDRQKFAEKENIFAAYLPYAIVFGCVTKWASAFSGIGASAATAGWYVGGNPAAFNAMAFSSSLSSFSSEVSTTIVSTPGGSGGSGFSGGASGGGGGGGGGGSW